MSGKLNVVAIDGPAAAGKSTIAEGVSRRMNVPHVNTGNMYRAVTWRALSEGVETLTDEIVTATLDGFDLRYDKTAAAEHVLTVAGRTVESEIRSPAVAARVSEVAALPSVRAWLVVKQRQLAAEGPLVMEGRDIGTVVFPNAKHKFFLTASPEVRARRRLAQEEENPAGATVASVAAEIAKRDEMDMKRDIAPLRMADDAELINTDEMTIEQVVDHIISTVSRRDAR